MKGEKEKAEVIRCVNCGKKVLRKAAIEINGRLYCCPDCARGAICDCQ